MPSHMRFDVILPYFTNLPKDVAVNTFHFQSLGDWDDSLASDIGTALQDFYNSSIGGNTLAKYIGSPVKRTTSACLIKGYELFDAEPRPPRYDTTWTLGAAASTSCLPLEVSVCGSYQADRLAGVPQSRRRGRIFIGPLNGTVLSGGGDSSFPVPLPAFVARLTAGMEALQSAFPPLGEAVWSVYSRKNDDMYAITNGWVDNDFDTQRRRGPSPTTRTLWVA